MLCLHDETEVQMGTSSLTMFLNRFGNRSPQLSDLLLEAFDDHGQGQACVAEGQRHGDGLRQLLCPDEICDEFVCRVLHLLFDDSAAPLQVARIHESVGLLVCGEYPLVHDLANLTPSDVLCKGTNIVTR